MISTQHYFTCIFFLKQGLSQVWSSTPNTRPHSLIAQAMTYSIQVNKELKINTYIYAVVNIWSILTTTFLNTHCILNTNNETLINEELFKIN